ncbi:hypothetical protein GCM10025779_06470 [Arthrobacter cryoconiti]
MGMVLKSDSSARTRTATRRIVFALAAMGTVALGLAVHFLVPGDAAGLVADALYTVLVYLFVGFLAPRIPRVWVAAVALAFSAAVELSQLSGLPAQLAQSFPPSRLVLGTTFSALDLVAYAIGAVAALAVDTAISARAAAWGSSQAE